MRISGRGLLTTILAWALAINAWAYDYPLKDPYLATIIGTPTEFRPALPPKVEVEALTLEVFPERRPPDVFWYEKGLRYSLAPQKGEAPLIFVIAGTGASHDSEKMTFLQTALHANGFHVVCLPSPTHMNFIATASTTGVPGRIVEDAQDLHRVMTLVWEALRGRIRVSSFHLTGYSLGAAQAAFVAKLDEERRVFNFQKVFMINPPVSLFTSAQILDRLLVRGVPGGPDNFDAFFQQVFGKFSEIYQIMGYVDFSGDYLYDAYREVYTAAPPSQDVMAGLIGTSFRLSSGNMVFSADVMSHVGLIVPRERVLRASDSLTDYFKVAARTSFVDYFDELLYPYFRSRNPGLTREELIDETSLRSIEGYLRRTPTIGVVSNADELILTPEDLRFLQDVFGARARIYPFGGHCGNLGFRDNVAHMIGFFRN